MRVAIFASGNGTNFETLVQAFNEHKIQHGKVVLLFCDHPNAPVIQRAKRLKIPYETFPLKQFASKTKYEQAILTKLQEYQVDLIALAGYMRVIGPTILSHYSKRIINLHPAYLPEFQGLHAIERAFDDHLQNGRTQTGVTLHYIDEGLDTGPVIRQEHVPIKPDDTPDELETRIHQTEHRLYPQVLNEVICQISKGEKE